jgi:hypothetical protein
MSAGRVCHFYRAAALVTDHPAVAALRTFDAEEVRSGFVSGSAAAPSRYSNTRRPPRTRPNCHCKPRKTFSTTVQSDAALEGRGPLAGRSCQPLASTLCRARVLAHSYGTNSAHSGGDPCLPGLLRFAQRGLMPVVFLSAQC